MPHSNRHLQAIWQIPLFLAIILSPAIATAGMFQPATLSTVIEARVQSISVFLVGFLFLAWTFKHVWNALHRVFPVLPELTYWRALIVALFWGLSFNLVLLMISGARELMTPGAWKRSGLVYELTEPSK